MENTIFIIQHGSKNDSCIKKEVENDDKIDICRLCLDLSKLRHIKTITWAKGQDSFKFIETEVKFSLPNEVCENCWQNLNDMLKFIKKCKDSYLIYTKMQQNCVLKEPESVVVKIEKDDQTFETIIIENEICNDNVEEKQDNQRKSSKKSLKHDENLIEMKIKDTKDLDTIEQEDLNQRKKENKTKKDVMSEKLCNCCGEKVVRLADHYKKSRSCKPKNYKCPKCPLLFGNRYVLDVHQKIKHDKMIFTCEICSKVLTNPQSFQRHRLLHVRSRKFICETCGKSYTRLHDLKDHKNSHLKIKPYECKNCIRYFSTRANLNAHLKRHQRKMDRKRVLLKQLDEDILCELCNRKFTSLRAFKIHLQSHNESREYRCKMCKCTFDDAVLYREHVETHVIEKKFSCPICHKNFATRPALDHHVLIHKEPSHPCPMCDKKFKMKSHLTRHLALIHNINKGKSFKCKYCDKPFNLKENLRAHERIHTGEKPYICHVCKNGFIDSSARKTHVRKVHGENEVENIQTVSR